MQRHYLAAAAAMGLLALIHPGRAAAQDFAGAWHGAVSNLAVNIVIAPDQQFTETFVTGGMTTDVKGHIVPFAPGVAFGPVGPRGDAHTELTYANP